MAIGAICEGAIVLKPPISVCGGKISFVATCGLKKRFCLSYLVSVAVVIACVSLGARPESRAKLIRLSTSCCSGVDEPPRPPVTARPVRPGNTGVNIDHRPLVDEPPRPPVTIKLGNNGVDVGYCPSADEPTRPPVTSGAQKPQ